MEFVHGVARRTFAAPPEGLWIDVSGAVDEQGAPLAPALLVSGGAAQNIYTIHLGPATALRGRVLDADGQGLAGVSVRASPWRPKLDGAAETEFPPHGFARTGEDGAFEIPGLAAEEYSVLARSPLPHRPATPVVWTAGREGLEIRLERGVEVVLTVVDFRDRPVAGAAVDVVETGRVRPAPSRTDASGKTRITGLDPRVECGLRVSPPEGRLDLGERWEPAWLPESGTLQLPLAGTILGVVRSVTGAPMDEGRVEWRHERGAASGSAAIAPDGSFRLVGVPPGEVRLRAIRPGGDWWDRYAIEETAHRGDQGVVLLLTRPGELVVTVTNPPRELLGQRGPALWAGLVPEPGKGEFRPGALGEGGRILFRGVKPAERYRVLLAGVGGRLGAEKKYVRLSDGKVPIELVEALWIRGKLDLPAKTTRVDVGAERDGVVAYGTMREDGSFEIGGLPEGVWKVRAIVQSESGLWTGYTLARAGGTAWITLRREGGR
jgi:hypothetical protein